MLSVTPEPGKLNHGTATKELLAWLDTYAKRISSESEQWGEDSDEERKQEMRSVNPRFLLRQWVLEEVIGKVERDADSGKRVLAKVMHVR